MPLASLPKLMPLAFLYYSYYLFKVKRGWKRGGGRKNKREAKMEKEKNKEEKTDL